MIATPQLVGTATRGLRVVDRRAPGWRSAEEELRWMLRAARAPKWRTMRQFAEAEMIIPDGRFKGSKFRVSRQPFTGLWLDAVDSGRWKTINTTGPTQTGKTFLASIIPLCYHLFERAETVIFGLPHQDMADDKWQKDLKPGIEASFPHMLPRTGPGSRGGKVTNSITFNNGATLKFMTGGGGDKSRAGFTARVLIVTEKDGFATTSELSAETNKLEQLRARTMHYGQLARHYEECTVTTEQAPTWDDFKKGSESRIAAPCPYCRGYVSPERADLAGWQEAENEVEARAAAAFTCPQCKHELTEDDRRAMNARGVLVHRGQSIDKGAPVGPDGRPQVAGPVPPTETLGFRWSAFQNLFRTAGDIAVDEWQAARATKEDDAERKLHQFVWCLPYQGDVEQIAALDAFGLRSRQGRWPKKLVPEQTIALTVGCDLGLHRAHWKAIAWLPTGSVVVDYDELKIESEALGQDAATLLMLNTDLRRIAETGWAWENHPQPRRADAVGIDARYQGQDKAVYQFLRERRQDPATAELYWGSIGFGHGQLAGHSYHQPKKTGAMVVHVGQDYHVAKLPAERVLLVEFDADAWKTWLHNRLICDAGTPAPQHGALVLCSAIPKEHTRLCRHLTSEKSRVEYDAEKGEKLVWVQMSRSNHWLDAGVIASIMGHLCGIRVIDVPPAGILPPAEPPSGLITPAGQPFSVLDR